MAYWIQETGNKYNMRNHRSYICDYVTDIEKLPRQNIYGEQQGNDTLSCTPCAAGSSCLCLEKSSVYILGKDTDEWQEV